MKTPQVPALPGMTPLGIKPSNAPPQFVPANYKKPRKKPDPNKKADAVIDAAYRATCSGIEINMMDIGKVFEVGRASFHAGDPPAVLAQKIRAFVETIRKN